MNRIFLDANIFLYAAGNEHPARAGCRRSLRALAEDAYFGITNAEVVQEVLFHRMRSRGPDDAAAVVRDLLVLFPDLLPVAAKDLERAAALVTAVPGLRGRDAVIVASMLNHGIEQILSVDPAFDRVPGIRRRDPTTSAFPLPQDP